MGPMQVGQARCGSDWTHQIKHLQQAASADLILRLRQRILVNHQALRFLHSYEKKMSWKCGDSELIAPTIDYCVSSLRYFDVTTSLPVQDVGLGALCRWFLWHEFYVRKLAQKAA